MANFTGQLITSPQTLTGSWANLGDVFDIDTYRSILLQTEITPNDSEGIKFRALISINGGSSQLTKKIIRTESADLIIPSEQEIGELSDGMSNITFRVPDGASEIQIQVKTEVLGSTAGEIETALASRSYVSDIIGEEVEQSSDFFLEASRGNISGASTINKYGKNDDIDKIASEVVWSFGGDYNWLSSAGTASIVSDSANDTLLGTGARTLVIEGLDADWNEQSETIEMDGLTPVVSSGTYRRLHRMYVATAGSSETNEGTIQATINALVVAEIPALAGQTLMAIYTIPAGKTGYLVSIMSSLSRKKVTTADFEVRTRQDGGAWRVRGSWSNGSSGTSAFNRPYKLPLKLEEKTDIEICSLVSEDDTGVSSEFDIILF